MKSKKPKNRPAYTELTLRGLKREVISRGLPFEEVLEKSIPSLQNWLHDNYHNDIDTSLIAKYDDYIENILTSIGSSDMIYPSLRLSYVGDSSEDASEIVPKIKKPKDKKEKIVREKTEQGIYSGTKKALTFECFNKDMSIEDTIEKVKNLFEDANEKSIKIWYKAAKRDKAKTLVSGSN